MKVKIKLVKSSNGVIKVKKNSNPNVIHSLKLTHA